MDKKQSNLLRLLTYSGKRRYLTYISLVLGALSSLAALVPFLYIWAILKEVIAVSPDYDAAIHIGHYGWMAVLWAVISIILQIGGLKCSHLSAFRIAANLRKTMMDHIMTLPLGFMDTLGSGKVRKWVQESTAATETYLAHRLPDKAGMYATVVGLAVLMFLFNWRMGLLCIATAVLALIVMFAFMIGPMLKEKMAQYGKALDNMSNEAVEYVRGVPVVKTFGQTIFSFKRFRSSIDEYQKWVIAYTLDLRRPMILYTVIINAVFALLIGFTLIMVKDAPTGEYLLNLLYYIIISPAISLALSRIMFASEDEMIVTDALGKVDNILSIEPLTDKGIPCPDGGEIVLQDVSYRYPGAERDAVHDVTLRIEPGQKIAFVGPSGGGKTTLASLIARFFDVTSGEITIGGVDIKDIEKKQLMEHISFVFQDSRLLKTSILENVRLGRPSATRTEVLEAMHRAQCDDILAKLPNGIDTILGTKGTYLSGGEQQRIAIARVMLKDTPVVILDEATAFADPDNETRVQQAFSALSKEKTLIMIAHRLSSVVSADCICVLQDGSISERGTHAELLAAEGTYATMWKEYCETVKWNIK